MSFKAVAHMSLKLNFASVALFGSIIIGVIFLAAPLGSDISNRFIAYLTFLALSFNAYVWWSQHRDRKVERIGRLRGCVIYMQTKSRYFLDLKKEKRYDEIEILKNLSEDTANRLAETVFNVGSLIRPEVSASTTALTSHLHLIAREPFERNDSGLFAFEAKWIAILKESDQFREIINEEIEEYKFHKLVKNFLAASLVSWKGNNHQ
jgi:diadenosine tetraphosphate (Ap4A) HIT family hydrolase